MADRDPWEAPPAAAPAAQRDPWEAPAPQLRSWGQLIGDTPEGPRFQLWPERVARGIGRDISNLVETFPEVARGEIDLSTRGGIEEAVKRVTPGVADILPTAPALGVGAKTIRAAAPTVEALRAAHKATEEELKTSGALLNPIGLDAVHDAIAGALEGENWYGDINAPNTFKLLGKLKGREGPQSFGEVRKIRESLNKVGGTDEDKAAANYAKRLIDDYLTRVPEQHVISGDPVRDAAKAREAAGNYRGAKRTEALDEAIDRAERQAGKSGTGWNLGNTMRQRIDAIINSPVESRYFTQDELGELRKIVVGTTGQNFLRYLGKQAPSGVVSSGKYLGALAAGGLAGHGTETAIWAALAAATATGAHFAENAVAERAIRKVGEMIRRDTPLGKSMKVTPAYGNPLVPQAGMYGAIDALLQPPDDALR
jgi:hypothetical protein